MTADTRDLPALLEALRAVVPAAADDLDAHGVTFEDWKRRVEAQSAAHKQIAGVASALIAVAEAAGEVAYGSNERGAYATAYRNMSNALDALTIALRAAVPR